MTNLRTVEIQELTAPPGAIRSLAVSNHRIRIHLGPPTRGICRGGPFLYERGEVDLVPAGLSDDWEIFDSSRDLIIALPQDLLDDATAGLGCSRNEPFRFPRFHFRDPRIEHIALALNVEREAGFPSGLIFKESLGSALAAYLVSGYGSCPPRATLRRLSPAQHRLLIDYIEHHLGESLSLPRLAAIAGLSVSHFKTLFRRTTGVPVHRYVVRRRAERARKLLRESGLPASQIALEVGFSHQSHMAQCIRRLFGAPPSSLTTGQS